MRDPGLHLILGFVDAHESTPRPPKDISIGSSVFVAITVVNNRHTDRQATLLRCYSSNNKAAFLCFARDAS